MMGSLEDIYDRYLCSTMVSTDSRTVEAGALFFALHGESFDGNKYALSALERGASVAVVDSAEVVEQAPEAMRSRLFLVEDTLVALQSLARLHRRTLGIPILAITGSNGKTTTKELVWRVLAQKYSVSVTRGNLNNHIGVPLTLLRMGSESEFGVVEMGANHLGEIATLCSIAEPNYGLITNIGRAHLEGFGGAEGVKRGKGELFDYLEKAGGKALYPSESEPLNELAQEHPTLEAVPYSSESWEVIPSENLTLRGGEYTLNTHLVGAYNRYNIAAAWAVGELFGVAPEAMVRAIEGYTPDNNRSQRTITPHNELILDAYNANPSSMQEALTHFLLREQSPLRRCVILGDMRELGDYATEEHARVVAQLRSSAVDRVFLVGEHFSNVAQETPYQTFKEVDALVCHLAEHPLRDHLILLKGSRGIALERVIAQL